MSLKEKLGDVWRKVVSAFEQEERIIYNQMPRITAYTLRDDIVHLTNGFDVACFPLGRYSPESVQNVGLVVPSGACEVDIKNAAQLFSGKAKEYCPDLDMQEVILYDAETSPGMPSRFKIYYDTKYTTMKL
ncbi:MAG: hypothetical protein CL561_08225 [Alphaproteobacteria bacterium]|nr:hypothetical protein [Alphaproteobacteria bacterium]